MIETIIATLDEYQLLPQQGTLVVAVSGGADSLCLLHVLHQLCGQDKRYPLVQLHVAHLDHQLRGTASAQDAHAVAALAQQWGLPYTLGATDVPALGAREHRSIEDAARVARYTFLRSVAQGQPIAVAHHRDDQVETLLLHWLRGGGLASMIGLQPRQGDIIRPLLFVTRADTHAYCAQHNLHPLEDASNLDTRYLRNRIRHELLPLLEEMNPGFRATLLRNAEVLQIDYAWLQEEIEHVWPIVVRNSTGTTIEIEIPALQQLPLSLQRHVLRRASALLCGGQSPLELRHFRILEDFIQQPTSNRITTLHLPHALHAERRRDILIFTSVAKQAERQQKHTTGHPQEIARLTIPGSVAVPGTPWIAHAEWLSTPTTTQVVQALQQQDWTTVRSLLPETPYSVYVDAETLITTPHDIYTLIVRTRKEGDRIQPLGMNQEKKIKEVLINRHIPRDERERIPLFFLDTPGGHCIWLGGIQLDHRVRLTPHTRSIVCLSLTSNTAVDSITP